VPANNAALAGSTPKLRPMDERQSWTALKECRQAERAYIMAVSRGIHLFIRSALVTTRAWVTHGLIDAGLAGNKKALGLLRGYYGLVLTSAPT